MFNFYRVLIFSSLFVVECSTIVFSQISRIIDSPSTIRHVDSIFARTQECSVIHYHERSYNIGKKMQSMSPKEIFNSETNDFSRLEIYRSGGYDPIILATVPLDNIILLDNHKIIIGLSQIEVSPYKIVVYSYSGSIIYKGNLGYSMIKVDFNKLRNLVSKNPALIEVLKQECNVIKEDSLYWLELNNDFGKVLGKDYVKRYFDKNIIYSSVYLPFQIGTYWAHPHLYHRIAGGYLKSSPFSDLIAIGNVPYVLILNNVDGGKSYIPLVSNFNIECELRSSSIFDERRKDRNKIKSKKHEY